MSVTTDEAQGGVKKPDAREAVFASYNRAGPLFWTIAAILGALVVLALIAWGVQLREGMGVAGYSDQSLWAIYLADVITIIGVSYGGAVVSAILRLTGATWRAPLTRLAEGTALVTVLVGAAMIIPHTARPWLLWELITRPNLASPVFWDFVAVMSYLLATVIFFTLPLVPDTAVLRETGDERIGRRRTLFRWLSRGWKGTKEQRRVLHGALGLISILIIPLAVSVHSVLSWAFSLVARPWWHESIWAPYFVVAALYSGVALVILVVAAFRRAYHLEGFITERHFVRLGFLLTVLGATYLYLTFADMLPGGYVGETGVSNVFHALLSGQFSLWFWLFVVCGGIIPLLLVALPWTRNTKGIVTASALIVPAMWLKRMLMVIVPANYDRVYEVFGAYHFTWVSVAITVGGFAAIPLLLMLLFRVVPLLDIHEIEEARRREAAEEQSSEKTEERVGSWGSARLKRRRGVAGALIAVLALGAVSLSAAPAHADDGYDLTIGGAAEGPAVALEVSLASADGQPVPHAKVRLLTQTMTFGDRSSQYAIGEVTTGMDGTATFDYEAAEAGSLQFTARYNDGSMDNDLIATVNVEITEALSAYHPSDPKLLAPVGSATAKVLLAVTATVWVVLIAQVVRVRRVCRRAD